MKKIMKKEFTALLFAAAFAAALTACGSSDTAQDEQEEQTQEESESVDYDEDALKSSTLIIEEDEDTGSSILDEQRVSEREDYINIEDLDIDEYVTLNDYKNMKVLVYIDEADDDTVEDYINSEMLIVTNRAVEEGDTANIDFVGKQDGVAFDNGSGSGYNLVIGSGTFIDGFEDGLIGVMPGETVDLELTFPDDYGAEALAGQDVVFTVTVNYIIPAVEYADLTDEDLAQMGLSYGTKEELWAAARAAVEMENFETSRPNEILNQILTESTIISVPEYYIEEQIQSYEIYMETVCQMYYGMSFEEYLEAAYEMTIDEFEEDVYEDCKTTAKQYLILEALARAEDIEVTREMVFSQAAEDIEGYDDYTVDEYIEEVGYTAYRMYVVQELLVERLVEIIDAEAVIQ